MRACASVCVLNCRREKNTHKKQNEIELAFVLFVVVCMHACISFLFLFPSAAVAHEALTYRYCR